MQTLYRIDPGVQVAPRQRVRKPLVIASRKVGVLRHRANTAKAGDSAAVTRDSRDAATSAGLRYVTDHQPGIRRVRVGKGFRYVTPQGSTVRAAADLQRIRSLAISTAWRDVWICLAANGHLQAIHPPGHTSTPPSSTRIWIKPSRSRWAPRPASDSRYPGR